MDLLNYEDEMICPVCNAIGRIKKRDKRVSDLSIPEFKKLWIECYEELERHKYDTATKEYDRLATKPIVINDISTKGGVPVSKEW